MIEDMKSGKINKIVVYKLDRLTRSIRDLETICTIMKTQKIYFLLKRFRKK